MIKDSFAYIANYLWRESIRNINTNLTETEQKSFSSNDYYYLTTIYYLGRPNFSQIAEALNFSKPAISVLVRKLAQLGLIEKIQSEEDRRVYYVSVTPKGKSIIEGDQELYREFDILIQKLLSSREQYDFIDNLLEEIVRNLTNKK